jgi:GNAT superfamily N-acetyltransferase
MNLNELINRTISDYLNESDNKDIEITDFKHSSFIDGKVFKKRGGELVVGKYSNNRPYGVVELFVDDDFRRQGVATELIKFAMDYFSDGFMAQVSNLGSLDLHYKLGFRSFNNKLDIESYSASKDRLLKNSSVGMASPKLLNNLEKYF